MITVRTRTLYGSQVERICGAGDMAQDEAEWSSLGRSARFPSGWWLLPAALVGLAFWGVFLLTAGKALANLAAVNVGG